MEEPQYVSFGSGGIKGAMYIGVLKAFFENWPSDFRTFLDNIRGACGSSIGALFALMLILKLDSSVIVSLTRPIVDNSRNLFPRLDVTMLVTEYGIDDGSVLRSIIRTTLNAGGISDAITFSGLHSLLKRDFRCVGTNMRTRQAVHFSHVETPDAKVLDAIYMSMCIPFMFTPQKHKGDIVLDGSLVESVMRVFPAEKTLHICFERQAGTHISSFWDYFQAVFSFCGDEAECLTDLKHCITLAHTSEMATVPGFAVDQMNGVAAAKMIRLGYAWGLNYTNKKFMSTIAFVVGSVLKLTVRYQLDPFADLRIHGSSASPATGACLCMQT